jgi:hypothetical protein
MHQFRQFLLSGCMGTMKSAFTPGRGGVNAQRLKIAQTMKIAAST